MLFSIVILIVWSTWGKSGSKFNRHFFHQCFSQCFHSATKHPFLQWVPHFNFTFTEIKSGIKSRTTLSSICFLFKHCILFTKCSIIAFEKQLGKVQNWNYNTELTPLKAKRNIAGHWFQRFFPFMIKKVNLLKIRQSEMNR